MYQKRDRLLSLFCDDFKKRFYLREISKLTKIPLKTTDRVLKKLEKENIVKAALEGKHKYFALNLDNVKTGFLLVEAEICRTLLFLDRYPAFKSFLKEIKVADAIVIVYGSFSRFEAAKDSDLDVLVISDRKITLPQHLLPYKIHKIDITKKSFLLALEKGEALIKEILSSHVILLNHSAFVSILFWYYGKT